MEQTRFKLFITRHRLPFAVTGVIVVALVLTAVSMSLYITSGTASLDLSRPGYTQVRDQVINQPQETFDDNGPMNSGAVANFKELFEAQKKSLGGLGNFSDSSLDDTSLQL